jgi:hypothetical protein
VLKASRNVRFRQKGAWDLGELGAEFEELIIADAPMMSRDLS